MNKSEAAVTEHRPTMSLDISVKVAKDMVIGKKVRVTIEGEVTRVSQHEANEYDPSEASMTVEIMGTPKVVAAGEFEDLGDDSDE